MTKIIGLKFFRKIDRVSLRQGLQRLVRAVNHSRNAAPDARVGG